MNFVVNIAILLMCLMMYWD